MRVPLSVALFLSLKWPPSLFVLGATRLIERRSIVPNPPALINGSTTTQHHRHHNHLSPTTPSVRSPCLGPMAVRLWCAVGGGITSLAQTPDNCSQQVPVFQFVRWWRHVWYREVERAVLAKSENRVWVVRRACVRGDGVTEIVTGSSRCGCGARYG